MCLHNTGILSKDYIFFTFSKKKIPYRLIRIRVPLNINVRDSTFFSTYGFRADTNDPLSCFLRFLNFQFKSAPAQIKVVNNGVFHTCVRNLHTKQHVKPHLYCICFFKHILVSFLV